VRIYLVTPRNPPSFWTYDEILPVIGKRCLFPNLSMPTLAGLTPSEHEVVLCDENVEDVDLDFDADIVGITGYLVHRERVYALAEEFRRRGRFVVVGGPFASLSPEELCDRCDVVFRDEAEETWPQFLRDFAGGTWQREYRPVDQPDLTRAPMPRFDLMKVDRYHALTVQFARGCPYTCEFCDVIVIYGRKPRAKRIEQVIAEIETCHALGARQIFLVDDNFIGNRKHAKALLAELARWNAKRGYPLHFQTEVSLNVAQDEECLALLQAARFKSVFVGIETPRAESLVEARKMQNLRDDPVASVHKIQSYGLQVQAGMIVGFDHDDASIFDEQRRFLEAARIPVTMAGMLQAMPKTPLHARMAAEGRLLGSTSGDAFICSNIAPRRMTRLELYRGYRGLITSLYGFRSFRRRALAFLVHCGPALSGRRHSVADVRLLLRVLWATVVRANPRRGWFTLSLLAATLVRRPRMLEDAVSLATVHQAFHEYVGRVCRHLDALIAELERQPS
jgi:radical SAM superfamily enzyme YgiQ (UPF0313 family)